MQKYQVCWVNIVDSWLWLLIARLKRMKHCGAIYQPESDQWSFNEWLSERVSKFETLKPIDRTPSKPGSDKNAVFRMVQLQKQYNQCLQIYMAL